MKQVKVCLGRFQPFTLGHLKMATYKDLKGPQDIQGFKGIVKQSELLREQPDLNEIKKQKTVIFSIYTPKGKVDTKHPFDADLMKKELEIVKKSYPEIEDILYTDSADICKWGEMLKKAGYQASVWLTGSDEAKPYVEMAMKVPEYEEHNRDNRDCKDAYTKSFYVESIERTEDETDFVSTISGTKVRQSLKDNDKELFSKMMPKGVDHLFDEFKEAVENAPEPKKKTKKIKEYLINMKNITDYIYEGANTVYTLEFGHNEKTSKGSIFKVEFVDVIDTKRRIESYGDKPGKYNMYEFAAPLFSSHYNREIDDEKPGKDGGSYYKYFAGDHSADFKNDKDVEVNNQVK